MAMWGKFSRGTSAEMVWPRGESLAEEHQLRWYGHVQKAEEGFAVRVEGRSGRGTTSCECRGWIAQGQKKNKKKLSWFRKRLVGEIEM